MRILYIHATVVPPPANVQTDRFFLLSESLEGDVLQPVWFKTPEEVEAAFGPGSYPVYTRGRFRYHWFLANRYSGASQRLAIFRFYLKKGLELCRERRPDCIVVYSHMTPGLMAGVLKLLTGVKVVIEIATSPQFVYITESPRPSWRDRLMHFYSDVCLHLTMWLSDRAHFLYPNLLSTYPLLRKTPNSVFHEFVPVSIMDRFGGDVKPKPFVLLVGSPWYLKGVDLLIEAFHRLSPDFPQVKLKILGYYPERAELDALIAGSSNIEVLKQLENPEAVRLISQATILVLPSRCEGMGRVLIEGMAAGIPLIGSTVGGIPFMIQDGVNGRLFPGNDSRALEQRLRELLADPALRKRMGEAGYRRAHTELNEKVYVEQFTRMVADAVQGNK